MRFFWNMKIIWKGVLTKYLYWTSPQSCPNISLNSEFIRYHKQKKQANITRLIIQSKRNVSLLPPFRGSITVETAFALPLFLFFCIQLISLISLIQLHSALQASLHQEVAQASLEAYAYEKMGLDISSGVGSIVEDTVLRRRVIAGTGKEYLDRSMIEGGSSGIHILYTEEAGEQDTVDIVISYRVKPVVDILGFSGFTMANRCRMKAWTGYQVNTEGVMQETQEEMVYITETGFVYHKSKNCTHLMLSIRPVETNSLDVLRNQGGGRYYACEHCGKGTGGIVFLTDQGDRYHTSLSCGGLKRTVYTVPISQAGGRRGCSRCAATG
jgi:hypothetical protein